MSDRTGFKLSRRSFLTVGGGLTLSGCTAFASSSRQQWRSKDAFPDDDARNRKCTVASLDSGSGTIDRMPFAYSLEGREDLHGTNQHVNVHLSAKQPIDVYVSNESDAVTRFAEMHQNGTKTPGESNSPGVGYLPEYTQQGVKSYDQLVEIPDGSTYIVIAVPSNRTPGTVGVAEGPIAVQYSFDCSYYLPFGEYKQLNSE